MKIILFASALALSTAAIAQDATAPATPPADATAPAATPDASMPPAAPATPDATAPAAAPDASAPAAAPDASAAPMTGDSSGNMAGAQQAASSVDDSSLPKCSKTVTDKCVQSGGKATGHHRAMHHKKK